MFITICQKKKEKKIFTQTKNGIKIWWNITCPLKNIFKIKSTFYSSPTVKEIPENCKLRQI